jgi:hypothetical protein
MCDGTGNVHIETPNVSKVFDLPCWICGASNFKGMNREQVAWYMKLHKALESIKGKSLRAGDCIAPQAWLTMKNAINLACFRLGITVETIHHLKATRYGETTASVNIEEEFRVYTKRLQKIPFVMASKA